MVRTAVAAPSGKARFESSMEFSMWLPDEEEMGEEKVTVATAGADTARKTNRMTSRPRPA